MSIYERKEKPIPRENPERERLDKSWERLYQQFVTMKEGVQRPDFLFIDVPPPMQMEEKWPLEEKLVAGTNTMRSYISINTGLATLSTLLNEKIDLDTGIIYANYLGAKSKNRFRPFNPHNLAELILSSQAKTIGLGLISTRELASAQSILQETRQLAQKLNLNSPKFIAGGAQASLDRQRTSNKLGIPLDNVIQGRALTDILNNVGEPASANLDQQTIISDPDFLKMPNTPNSEIVVNMPLISMGGEACIGRECCDFCTAYFLGPRVELDEEIVKKQIKLLAQQGFNKIQASDNFINLMKERERDRFFRILEYATDQGVRITDFLIRPDILGKVPIDEIKKIRRYGIKEIFIGFESGDNQTLIEMNKTEKPIDYKRLGIKAIENLKKANINPNISIILGYPVDGINARKADYESLRWLTFLEIRSRKVYNMPSNVNIHLNSILPFPGSKLTQELIERGATQQDLDDYITESQVKSEELRNKLYREYEARTLNDILVIKQGNVPEILDFCQERRKALNRLLDEPYRYLDKI